MADATPRAGNAKVTRDDWLELAQEILIASGVESVRILTLGRKLGVSRSSFYWYFESRQDLLDQLLERWRLHNTRAVVERALRPAPTITQAVLNVSECWVNPALFNPRLDFAIRAWARGDARVRRIIDQADAERLEALDTMYQHHGYEAEDAAVRAKVLYLTQIAYFSLEITETLQSRIRQVRFYVRTFTGKVPSAAEQAAFARYAEGVAA